MRDGFVKLISFMRPEEAHIVLARLESEGIVAFIANENTVRMDFFWSQAVGGVQLWVREEDWPRAKQILDGAAQEDIHREESPDTCPKCGSQDTFFEKGPATITKIFFYVGIPIPFFKKHWKCRHCGHTWKPSK